MVKNTMEFKEAYTAVGSSLTPEKHYNFHLSPKIPLIYYKPGKGGAEETNMFSDTPTLTKRH